MKGFSVEWKVENGQLIIELPVVLPKGAKATTIIKYSGKPGGVEFSESKIYSNYDSCKWLLCSDQPGDKFSANISIKVPKGWSLISSGILVSVKGDVHTWSAANDFPGYLLGFAMGDFSTHKQTYASKDFKIFESGLKRSQLSAIFSTTFSAYDFFYRKAGFSLPTDTYSQVIVPGHLAQEKSTFSLLGKKFLEPMFTTPSEDWLIVHELAHQWWGNSIICSDWSHFWLNEGVTVFMVASYKKEKWGDDHYQREVDLAKRRYKFALDNKFDVPLTFSGTYPSLQMKRAIVYSKGMLFLDALKNLMGEKPFWKGIKRYSRKYKGTTVTSKMFEIKMQQETSKELGAIFKKWVY